MKLETIASEFLDLLYKVSKVAKDGNKKMLLSAEGEDNITIYSNNALVYAKGKLGGRVIDPGVVLIPFTVIPQLAPLGDNLITLEVDDNNISIVSNFGSIDIPQISGSIRDVSVRAGEPDWLSNLSRLKNVIYASGEEEHALNVVWVIENKIITSDRYRAVVYKLPDKIVDEVITIGNFVKSYIDAKGDNGIYIDDDNVVWLGNDTFNISTTQYNVKIPDVLVRLSNESIKGGITFKRDDLLKEIVIINNLKTKDYFAADFILNSDGISMKFGSDKGQAELFQVGLGGDEVEERFRMRIDYLYDAVNNCSSPTIVLKKINETMIYVGDTDVHHYINTLLDRS